MADTQEFINVQELKSNDIENDNTGLGFYGETPVVQPTSSVSISGLFLALIDLGLIGSEAL